MKDDITSANYHTQESDAVFQKRVQDLILDFSEAESRVHNTRFVDKGLRRKFFMRLETYIRRNKFLFAVALKIKNKL